MENFKYLGPLREIPSRTFEVLRSPDAARWATGLSAWDRLASGDKELIDSVNEWLFNEERLNSGYALQQKRFIEADLDVPEWTGLPL